MKYLLSILIPTTIDRIKITRKLELEFKNQIKNLPVEIVTKTDNKEMPIGKKRELLYLAANGEYSVQWDSDDWISPNGLIEILNGLKYKPDCVTYQEHCIMDKIICKSNHSLQYNSWEGSKQKILSDGFNFHRTPYFKSVIKTEIAKQIPIPHIRFGEDHQWSKLIKPELKKEVHISKYIYIYRHTSSPYHTRYGFDKDGSK